MNIFHQICSCFHEKEAIPKKDENNSLIKNPAYSNNKKNLGNETDYIIKIGFQPESESEEEEEEKNQAMDKIVKVIPLQNDRLLWKFHEEIKKVAKDLDIECSFPKNAVHCNGTPQNLKRFQTFLVKMCSNPTEEEKFEAFRQRFLANPFNNRNGNVVDQKIEISSDFTDEDIEAFKYEALKRILKASYEGEGRILKVRGEERNIFKYFEWLELYWDNHKSKNNQQQITQDPFANLRNQKLTKKIPVSFDEPWDHDKIQKKASKLKVDYVFEDACLRITGRGDRVRSLMCYIIQRKTKTPKNLFPAPDKKKKEKQRDWTFFDGLYSSELPGLVCQRRVQGELQDCLKDDLIRDKFIIECIDRKYFFQWIIHLNGPENTPYRNGIFQITILFPADYPFDPPLVQFLTKIYHPCVDVDGTINLGVLGRWDIDVKIRDILLTIYRLLHDPTIEDPIRPNLLLEYRNNKFIFDQKAAFYTQEYAVPKVEEQSSPQTV